jgi:hypothetical protein
LTFWVRDDINGFTNILVADKCLGTKASDGCSKAWATSHSTNERQGRVIVKNLEKKTQSVNHALLQEFEERDELNGERPTRLRRMTGPKIRVILVAARSFRTK